MSRFARKVDDNQADIVEALRLRGHRVQSLASVGNGCPDLLVGARRMVLDGPMQRVGRSLVVLEVKGARNKRGDLEPLTPAETEWHIEWRGWPVYIVGSVRQAIDAVEGA